MLPMSMSEFADANCSCSASMSSLVITRRGFAGFVESCATAGGELMTGVVAGPGEFPETGFAAAKFGLSRSATELCAEGLGLADGCGLSELGAVVAGGFCAGAGRALAARPRASASTIHGRWNMRKSCCRKSSPASASNTIGLGFVGMSNQQTALLRQQAAD